MTEVQITGEHEEPLAIFTAGDRLRLLQLMTQRAMAERYAKACKQGDGDLDASPDASQNLPDGETPDRWRLIPGEVSLHDWQRECLPSWMEHGRGTVKVATGGGKTLFALAVAQQLQNEREPDLRLVVVVPTIPLMYQWRDELRRGNLPDADIAMLGGGEELPPLWRMRALVCVLHSARERLPELVKNADWRHRMLLVVDECHRTNAKKSRCIFETRPAYTLGLSATPEQELETGRLPTDATYDNSFVGQALGPVIYDFTIGQSLGAGLLTPFEVWHIGLSLVPEEAGEYRRICREINNLHKMLQPRHRNSRSTQAFIPWCQSQANRGDVEAKRFLGLAGHRKQFLYRAKARIEVTLSILSESVSDPDLRAIVFHESIAEIESLFIHAIEQGLPAVLEHSKLPDSLRKDNIEAFRQGVARVIISGKSLVEGFNVPSADLGIITASSSSARQRIQSLGRLLRRKSGGRDACVVVLYVSDTEDEKIYEKADWETIIGAERNRYFVWHGPVEGKDWTAGLEEVLNPPLPYKPPSWEVDVNNLDRGAPYPGKPDGMDLRVDHSGNLRTEDGTLFPVGNEYIEAVLEYNSHRRARRTHAGHLIAHGDNPGSGGADWRYLGKVELPDNTNGEPAIRLRLQRRSGRRVIARKDERRNDIEHFALGPGESRSPEAGKSRDRLLEWVRGIEATERIKARELYWDKGTRYWLEIGGRRIKHPTPLAPLEFAT